MRRFYSILMLVTLVIVGCAPAADVADSAEITPLPNRTAEVNSAEIIPIPQKPLADCTASADTPFTIGVLPQENGSIELHSFDMPPNGLATITFNSEDSTDGLQTTVTADNDGHFTLILTPDLYDYVRWNIFVEHADAMHCQYVIMSGSEWLEQGYQGPETHQNDADALAQDIAMAAESLGIDPDVLRLGSELEDEVTKLNAIIRRNEADTYAGMRLDYEDGFRVIFSFTENGAATLAAYVDADHPLADYVVVEGSAYTEAQLLADQQAVNEILSSAEIPFTTAVIVSKGIVELSLPAPEVWDVFLAENPVELPPSVVINFASDGLPSLDPPDGITIANDIYMAQLKIPDLMFMQALNNATLSLEDGCLFAGSGDERILIVWQPGHFATEQAGNIVIVDLDGETVAAVGEMLYMGGGFVGVANDNELIAPVPTVCQTEDSFRMGSFLPEEYRDAGE